MKFYRTKHPRCAFCDWDKGTCHVHHIEPIKYAPDRAGDPLNFITLCPKCHHVVGHARNWKQFCENVKELCEAVKIVGDMHLTQ
jgi:predicted HNH restriction endonuclease